MFILSVACLAIYRIITAYLVFKFTEYNMKRLLYQLFDAEIFMAIRISVICNNLEPCNPQRWLSNMEAVLESTPQTVIQLIYLQTTGGFNAIIGLSLISSIWSIISKVSGDDKHVINPISKAEKLNFNKAKKSICYLLWSMIKGFFVVLLIIVIGMCLFPLLIYRKSMELMNYNDKKDSSLSNKLFKALHDLDSPCSW
eukprot:327319_1